MLVLLLPGHGSVGAVIALMVSSFAEALVLGWFTIHLYGVPVLEFIPWRRVGKVFFAADRRRGSHFEPVLDRHFGRGRTGRCGSGVLCRFRAAAEGTARG
jgi:hypothetical protein